MTSHFEMYLFVTSPIWISQPHVAYVMVQQPTCLLYIQAPVDHGSLRMLPLVMSQKGRFSQCPCKPKSVDVNIEFLML